MKASQWIRDEAASVLNNVARELGTEAKWSLVQKDGRYPSVGIFLPELHSVVNRTCPGFDRVHFAVGLECWDRYHQHEEWDFELGTEAQKSLYIGIRIHRGAQTVTKALHHQIYDTAVDHLQKATSPELAWQPRDQFWSVWAYVPTTRDGQVLSADEYREFVVAQALKGYDAIKGLWTGASSSEGVGSDLLPPSATNSSPSRRTQWEYHLLEGLDPIVLNALGADGWEVVGLTTTSLGPGAVLKRPR